MRHDDPNAERDNAAPPFVCSRTQGPVKVGWVRIAGALDSASAPGLKRALRERRLRTRLVVLDLRELTFIDRSGMHAVVDAGLHAREAGRRLFVMHVAPQFRRRFAQAGVEIADLHLVGRPVPQHLPPTGGDWAA